jgi:hypothetical protein
MDRVELFGIIRKDFLVKVGKKGGIESFHVVCEMEIGRACCFNTKLFLYGINKICVLIQP